MYERVSLRGLCEANKSIPLGRLTRELIFRKRVDYRVVVTYYSSFQELLQVLLWNRGIRQDQAIIQAQGFIVIGLGQSIQQLLRASQPPEKGEREIDSIHHGQFSADEHLAKINRYVLSGVTYADMSHQSRVGL